MTSRESVRTLKLKEATLQVHDVTCITSAPVKSDFNHHHHHHHHQQQQHDHHHHHLHNHQHHHHHHLGSYRSQLNGYAYKMQSNSLHLNNNQHPQRFTVCNNNSSSSSNNNSSSSNNNSSNNNSSNNNSSSSNKNFLRHQKQAQGDKVKAPTSNEDHHHHDTCEKKPSDNNNNNIINCNNIDVAQLVETENTWKTSTGIVGLSFASVVASKTASTSDALVAVEDKMVDCTDEEVDDGFEDSNSISHHHHHRNSNNCCDSSCNNCVRSTEASGFHPATSDGNADVVEEDGKQSSKKNPTPAIRDIPERFKKLLKAAADKATAQRLRVEGAPLIRSFPQPAAAPMGYIFPQPTPPVMVPSYPSLVPQPMYVHSSGYEVQSSSDQGGLAPKKSPSPVPQGSPQVNSYVQPATEYYSNALPAYRGQYMASSNHSVPVVSATPYGHMTYYIAPAQPQYQVVYGPEAQYYCCSSGAPYLDQQLCPLQQHQCISDQQQQSNFQDSMLAC